MSLTQFEQLAREAVLCRVCFDQGLVKAPAVDLAQPRWIGPGYWKAQKRIAVLMLNPGSGAFRERSDPGDERAGGLLRSFASGNAPIGEYFEHQAHDMPVWGRGRFSSFYFLQLGLELQSVAFANVAWCASEGNKYPSQMLNTCFKRHTEELFRILAPHVVLLSGSNTHPFSEQIKAVAPNAAIVKTLHYAHRESHERERLEVIRVRSILNNA